MKKSYYAVIPASVRYCEALQANAKLLYGEITALCNQEGYCWASNQYFSELYGTSDRSIQRWVKSLEKQGFIRTQIRGDHRKIFIVGGDKNVMPRVTKLSGSARQNCHHNITGNKTRKRGNDKSLPPSKVLRGSPRSMDYVPIDEDGNETAGRKKAGGAGLNKIALRIRRKFGDLCEKHLGTRPVDDVKSYQIVLFALKKGKLSEEQIYDLFDEWFKLGKPDDETIAITRALSGRQIEGYKVRNGVK